MTNEILKFGDTATNILTQAEYASDPQRNLGNIPGIARSKLVNKAIRQSAFVVNALTSLVEDVTGANVLDDDDTATLKTNIQALIQQLANKEVAFKDAVEYATTSNITLSGLQNIDGGTGVAGQRILVKNQSTASQNGIYEQQVGSWTRTSDFDGTDEVEPGSTIPVLYGTANAATAWILTTAAPVIVGTTNLTFVKLAGTAGIPSLSGEATAGIDGVTTLSNAAVIGKVLTGYTPAAGTVTASDSIIGAIQKIDANVVNSFAGGYAAGASGLKVQVTSDTNTTITANQIALSNGSGLVYIANSVNISNNITTSGAGGLDTGSETADTWYSVWVVYNGTTVSSLLSTSSTSPTMPSGYTYKARVAWIRNNASSNLYRTLQHGNETVYVCGTNPVSKIIMASGNSGGIVPVSISSYVPPTAYKIQIVYTHNNFSDTMIMPNNTGWGASYFIYGVSGNINSQVVEMVLESSDIYWQGFAASSGIAVYGWTDNL